MLPGSDKCTDDHGEDSQLDGRGEGLPVSNRWEYISVIWGNDDEAPRRLRNDRFHPLQQHSFEHHGEENAESPQHSKHGQAGRQEFELVISYLEKKKVQTHYKNNFINKIKH